MILKNSEKILRSNRETVADNVYIKILNKINIGACIKKIKIDIKEILKKLEEILGDYRNNFEKF